MKRSQYINSKQFLKDTASEKTYVDFIKDVELFIIWQNLDGLVNHCVFLCDRRHSWDKKCKKNYENGKTVHCILHENELSTRLSFCCFLIRKELTFKVIAELVEVLNRTCLAESGVSRSLKCFCESRLHGTHYFVNLQRTKVKCHPQCVDKNINQSILSIRLKPSYPSKFSAKSLDWRQQVNRKKY